MKTIKTNKKLAIFSDIHIGLEKDNPRFHKANLEYADWLISECKKNEVEIILFGGDFYHNRFKVATESAQNADDFLHKVTSAGLKIIMITGNHDCVYNESSDVNSVSVLRDRKGLMLIDGEFTQLQINDKVFGFAPWGVTTADMVESDVILGHFDIQGFLQKKNVYAEKGFSTKDLMSKSKLVISGHYHIPQEKDYKRSGSKFVYVGSPYQHDFSDVGIDRYLWFIDTEDLSLTKIENKISPEFIHITKETDLGLINNRDRFKIELSVAAISTETVREITEKSLNLDNVDLILKDKFVAPSVKKKGEDDSSFDIIIEIDNYCATVFPEEHKAVFAACEEIVTNNI